MNVFRDGVRTARRILRSPGRRESAPEQVNKDVRDKELLARIAQRYPELILMASEMRDYGA